jgi:hypothetical protein
MYNFIVIQHNTGAVGGQVPINRAQMRQEIRSPGSSSCIGEMEAWTIKNKQFQKTVSLIDDPLRTACTWADTAKQREAEG